MSLNRPAVFLLAALAACTPARQPVPEALVERANVAGYGKIRFWGDDAGSMSRELIAAEAAQSRRRSDDGDWYFLVISGGGSNGAFGAGILTGWTANGTRPEFDVVTGVSTGSLIAPFAFLGPTYDNQLTSAFTDISSPDIYRSLGVLGAIGIGAFEDDTPLRRLVEGYVTDAMVADLAREQLRGRRLLIASTNLDAGRQVAWDVSAIAASGVPGRRQLITDVLVASASIPGVFPPARIQVVADGVAYDELHVDGGATAQAFLFPPNFTRVDLDLWTNNAHRRNVYIIRNSKVAPEYSVVHPRFGGIVSKSIDLLIETQGVGDLYRMYDIAGRVGVDFNAIWIPESFSEKEPKPFDQGYMRDLYTLGHRLAKGGIPWSALPPQ